MDIEILKNIAKRFESLSRFVAKNRVDSDRLDADRTCCVPGDEVVVVRWYCHLGPTVVKVNGREYCLPFEWVMEMGAPTELAQYMPFPRQSWSEILANEGSVG